MPTQKKTYKWIKVLPWNLKFCHGNGTSGKDEHARKFFNQNYDAKLQELQKKDPHIRHKCLQCDCSFGTDDMGHIKCEKPENKKCIDGGVNTYCTFVAAHCYNSKSKLMYLARTCKSCNTSGRCWNYKGKKGAFWVMVLGTKLADY